VAQQGVDCPERVRRRFVAELHAAGERPFNQKKSKDPEVRSARACVCLVQVEILLSLSAIIRGESQALLGAVHVLTLVAFIVSNRISHPSRSRLLACSCGLAAWACRFMVRLGRQGWWISRCRAGEVRHILQLLTSCNTWCCPALLVCTDAHQVALWQHVSNGSHSLQQQRADAAIWLHRRSVVLIPATRFTDSASTCAVLQVCATCQASTSSDGCQAACQSPHYSSCPCRDHGVVM
jgi:hypothetical protein